jgi:THAP4-like, heme-binding beta-barrel domain
VGAIADLPRELAPLAWLVGAWRGEGRGGYPTVDDFEYGEQTSFTFAGKPFLAYAQRTWLLDGGSPSHSETGYLRARPEGVEMVVAEPSGVVEVYAGELTEARLELRSTLVGRTPTAKQITAVRRVLERDGDDLHVLLDMEAVGQPLTFHLEATLSRP